MENSEHPDGGQRPINAVDIGERSESGEDFVSLIAHDLSWEHMNKIVFLDRDGTLVYETPDELVDSFEKLRFIPGVFNGLARLAEAGYRFVMVTNQDHLGTDILPDHKFFPVHQRIIDTFQGEGIAFEKIFICPHTESDGCECRKPSTGLVDAYLKEIQFDPSRSWMVGDRETDVEFGVRIGVRTIRLSGSVASEAEYQTDSFLAAVEYILGEENDGTAD